jgi:enamine deaminase RidA (YjgF/YER057c/UK114 family)
VEAKIESLGLAMPNPAVPKGKFVNFVQIDNMVYLSGHLPQVGCSFVN